LNLTLDEFAGYFNAMRAIQAEEMMIAFGVADWPNMKENERSKRWKALSKDANPMAKSKGKTLSNKELAEILKHR
jgi:hypothetical protein